MQSRTRVAAVVIAFAAATGLWFLHGGSANDSQFGQLSQESFVDGEPAAEQLQPSGTRTIAEDLSHAAVRSIEPSASLIESTGFLRILLRDSGVSAPPDSVVLHGDGKTSYSEQLRGYRLEAGEWSVSVTVGSGALEERRIDIESGSEHALWIGERVPVGVLVLDPWGAPIADATVTWTQGLQWSPLLNELPRTEERPSSRSQTNNVGHARLACSLKSRGTLSVVAEGFVPFSSSGQTLSTLSEGSTLQITLARDLSPPIRLNTLDANSEEPIPGAIARGLTTGISYSSDDLGVVEVPRELGANEVGFLVMSEGYIPAVYGSELEVETSVHLIPSMPLAVRVGNLLEGEGVFLRLEPSKSQSGDDRGLELLAIPQFRVGEQAVPVEIARGQSYDILAVSTLGRSRELLGYSSNDAEAELELLLEDREALEIEVADELGNPVEQFVVRARYTREAYTTLPSRDGVVLLPQAEALTRFSVAADGYESMHLRAASSRNADGNQRGSLSLTARASASVEITVVNEQGAPVPQYLVRATDGRIRQAADQHPSLFGCWPTNHPAWNQAIEPTASDRRIGVTDALGVAYLHGIPSGSITFSAAPHPESSPRIAASLAQSQPVTMHVVPGLTNKATLVVETRQVASFQVVDATTDHLISDFLIQANSNGSFRLIQGHSGFWQGWCREGEVLAFSSSGYQSASVNARIGHGEPLKVALIREDGPLVWVDGGGEIEDLSAESYIYPDLGSEEADSPAWQGLLHIEKVGDRFGFKPPRLDTGRLVISGVFRNGKRIPFTAQEFTLPLHVAGVNLDLGE